MVTTGIGVYIWLTHLPPRHFRHGMMEIPRGRQLLLLTKIATAGGFSGFPVSPVANIAELIWYIWYKYCLHLKAAMYLYQLEAQRQGTSSPEDDGRSRSCEHGLPRTWHSSCLPRPSWVFHRHTRPDHACGTSHDMSAVEQWCNFVIFTGVALLSRPRD